jgi:flagellar basal-body rod protein FlgB
MKSISNHIGIYADALSLRSKRNEMLASNIANAATPNFKARDMNFDAEIRKISHEGPMRTSDERHFPLMTKGGRESVLYRQPLQASIDGNTVEMNVEQMEFSENVMRYQTTLTFLNNRISGLMTAIRGE